MIHHLLEIHQKLVLNTALMYRDQFRGLKSKMGGSARLLPQNLEKKWTLILGVQTLPHHHSRQGRLQAESSRMMLESYTGWTSLIKQLAQK
jgi:hypothetical protein